MRKSKIAILLLSVVILLSATPAFAATQLTRFHCDINFNQAVGAQFIAYDPCEADWSSWGITSGFKEIIQNWDDCESGPETRTCWEYKACCGTWQQVTCP